MRHSVELKADETRIPADHPWQRAWMVPAVFAVVGAVLSAFGWMQDPDRFAFSWLYAVVACLTVPLGGLFFVFISFLTASHWSVSIRRLAEFLAAAVPVLALLFVPVWLSRGTLYEWSAAHGDGHGTEHAEVSLSLTSRALAETQEPDHANEGGHDASESHAGGHHSGPQAALHHDLLEHKSGWLNDGRVGISAILYFLIWTALAWFYFRTSTRQDESKDLGLTAKMQRMAPLTGILFALTLTFAVFDWVMSLEPTWYSTIYGVYVFAGTAVTSYVVLILLSLWMKSSGLLGEAVNVEHYHDLGKMLFGFVVFWTYVGASQLLLIWYANIPEETIYYYRRFHTAGWNQVSILLILGHFLFPFLFLMSNSIKRRLGLLQFGCAWLFVMHLVDIYWFVMPMASEGGLAPSWIELTSLFAVFGTYFTVVLLMMRHYPLIAVGDPRLPRALAHVQ